MLTCNSHPSSSFLSPKKTKIGSGISRPCQETYQLLCHDVVVTEGLEQGHEANLTASWGGRQKGALLFRIFASCHCRGTQIPAARLQICLPKPGSEAGPGSPSACSGPGSQFSPLCGFPRFRENFSQVKKKWKEQEREEKNKKYGSFFLFHAILPWDLPALFAAPAARRPTADHDTNERNRWRAKNPCFGSSRASDLVWNYTPNQQR